MRPLRNAFVLAVVGALSACATAPEPFRYVAVHRDTVTAQTLPRFESARREWLAALVRARTSDRRGQFFQADGLTFLTLRPIQRLEELDHRSDVAAQVRAAVGSAAQERYDRASDESLVAPHRSELWAVEPDLAYAPAGGGMTIFQAGAARMIVEQLRPDPASEDRYAHAWSAIRDALVSQHYPLARQSFFSAYGTGELVTFWIAPTGDALHTAPSVLDALRAAVGDPEAQRLFAEIEAAVVSTQSFDVVARPDLSSPR